MLRCKVDNISYENNLVLRDIFFELKKGQTLLLTGESGSGKSTLLSFIAGFLQQNKNVEVNGRCDFFSGLSAESIAYIAQDPETNLICNDVKSEILLNGTSNVDNINTIINDFKLDAKILEAKVQNLSGGQQQLLAIACAELRNCQIYLFDEPTAMLDHENAMIVVESIKKLKKNNKIIIIASHEPDFWKDSEEHINLAGGFKKTYTQTNSWLLDSIKRELINFEVKNLSFGYENENLINDLSFKLESGDVLCVTGKNGKGKTTLAKLLAGMLKPRSGTVTLNGLQSGKHKNYLPEKLGFSFQNPNWQLLFETVSQEVMYCTNRLTRENQIKLEAFVHQIFEQTGIKKDSDPRELSFGQRKFITNYSFLNFPQIHIFDEPEIALDTVFKKFFCDYVGLRKKMGLITIIISHRTEILDEHFTNKIVLN